MVLVLEFPNRTSERTFWQWILQLPLTILGSSESVNQQARVGKPGDYVQLDIIDSHLAVSKRSELHRQDSCLKFRVLDLLM